MRDPSAGRASRGRGRLRGSADEKALLFSSNRTGIFNVNAVPVAGEPRRPSPTRRPTRPGSERSNPSRSGGRASGSRSTRRSGDPGKDRGFLTETSPLFHADKIRKPLIVVQGANDPRVIKPESDDIVAAVKKNGVPVEYVLFPDEGHGFTKKKNEITAWRSIREFLDRYLKAAPAPD